MKPPGRLGDYDRPAAAIDVVRAGRPRQPECGHRFLGELSMVWLEKPDADGKIHRPDCTALLVYRRDSITDCAAFSGKDAIMSQSEAAENLIGSFAPKLFELTDRVVFDDVWELRNYPSATEA